MIKLFDPSEEMNKFSLDNTINVLKPNYFNFRAYQNFIRIDSGTIVKYKGVFYRTEYTLLESDLEEGEYVLLGIEPNNEELNFITLPYENSTFIGAYTEDNNIYVNDTLILPYAVKNTETISEGLLLLNVYEIKNLNSLNVNSFVLLSLTSNLYILQSQDATVKHNSSYSSKNDLSIEPSIGSSVILDTNNIEVNNKTNVASYSFLNTLSCTEVSLKRNIVIASDNEILNYNPIRGGRTKDGGGAYVWIKYEIKNNKYPGKIRANILAGAYGLFFSNSNMPDLITVTFYVKRNNVKIIDKGNNDCYKILNWSSNVYLGLGLDEYHDIQIDKGDNIEIYLKVDVGYTGYNDAGAFFLGMDRNWGPQGFEQSVRYRRTFLGFESNEPYRLYDGKYYSNINQAVAFVDQIEGTYGVSGYDIW